MGALLTFDSISKYWQGQTLLAPLSGELNSGETIFLQGPSGAGKSTLMKILSRLCPADSGRLSFRGVDTKEIPAPQWRRCIQYLPQRAALFEGTAEQNLRLPFTLSGIKTELYYDAEAAARFMSALDLDPTLLSHTAFSLSGGEAARLCLVRALLLKPSVLLLDEPTASLDEDRRRRLIDLLQEWRQEAADRALMIISHHPSDLEQLKPARVMELVPHRQQGGER